MLVVFDPTGASQPKPILVEINVTEVLPTTTVTGEFVIQSQAVRLESRSSAVGRMLHAFEKGCSSKYWNVIVLLLLLTVVSIIVIATLARQGEKMQKPHTVWSDRPE
jgi:hypothetical protein